MKMVHGVGVNDAGYKTHKCKTIEGVTRSYWRCPFYKVWAGMIERAYDKKCHKRNPTYSNVTVNKEWHKFSAFKKWMESQPWEGNELDKDILVQGNREYSKDMCCFVPCALNSFLANSGASRGRYPIGVTWDSFAGKFKASCRNPFTKKVEHLGRFDDPDKAHQAWKARKHEIACRYADMQNDKRIADALRKRFIN